MLFQKEKLPSVYLLKRKGIVISCVRKYRMWLHPYSTPKATPFLYWFLLLDTTKLVLDKLFFYACTGLYKMGSSYPKVFLPFTSMLSLTSRHSLENLSKRVNFSTGENMLVLPPSHTPSFSVYSAGVNFSDTFNWE